MVPPPPASKPWHWKQESFVCCQLRPRHAPGTATTNIAGNNTGKSEGAQTSAGGAIAMGKSSGRSGCVFTAGPRISYSGSPCRAGRASLSMICRLCINAKTLRMTTVTGTHQGGTEGGSNAATKTLTARRHFQSTRHTNSRSSWRGASDRDCG